jgi:ADP-ribose pyrophosphatase
MYQGWLTVMRDRLLKPAGGEMDYTYVASSDAAAVLAFTDGGQVVLTRQYRHPLRRVILDLPAGGVREGETPEQAARRELAEETGFVARDLRPLGRFFPAPGIMGHAVHVFCAREIARGSAAPDEHEIIHVARVEWPDLLRQVVSGEAADVTLAYAVLLYAAQSQGERRSP